MRFQVLLVNQHVAWHPSNYICQNSSQIEFSALGYWSKDKEIKVMQDSSALTKGTRSFFLFVVVTKWELVGSWKGYKLRFQGITFSISLCVKYISLQSGGKQTFKLHLYLQQVGTVVCPVVRCLVCYFALSVENVR